MKTLLPGHYRADEAELHDMMRSATVVLDSSTLLNLYRDPKQVRSDFINVLRHVENSIMNPPHRVALEFGENGLSVIADQVARFKDVRDLISGTERTFRGEIDELQLKKEELLDRSQPFLTRSFEIFKSFLKTLNTLERAQPNVPTRISFGLLLTTCSMEGSELHLQTKLGRQCVSDGNRRHKIEFHRGTWMQIELVPSGRRMVGPHRDNGRTRRDVRVVQPPESACTRPHRPAARRNPRVGSNRRACWRDTPSDGSHAGGEHGDHPIRAGSQVAIPGNA